MAQENLFLRRLDIYGRIAIPKELRMSENLQDGDNFQCCVNENGDLVLKKYKGLRTSEQLCKICLSCFLKEYKTMALIFDNNRNIVAAAADSNIKKALISEKLQCVMKLEKPYLRNCGTVDLIPYTQVDCMVVVDAVIPLGNAQKGILVVLGKSNEMPSNEILHVTKLLGAMIGQYIDKGRK